MALAYDMAYSIALLVSSPVWGWRMLRTGKWRTDWRGRFGRCQLQPDDRPTLLIHSVSVGEVNAIRQLVPRLYERTQGQVRIVIGVTTNTGIEQAQRLFGPSDADRPTCEVIRYPLDFGACVRSFLDAVRPNLVATVELEVWPNFISECTKRKIPVCVINGRLSSRSFRGYHLGGALVRPMFARLTVAAVQTEEYAWRFEALGTQPERIRVLDTMKWDAAEIAEPEDVQGADELAKALGIDRSKPVIVAGSTGPGEERMLIDTCPVEAQLVLVPRKPERFDEVASLEPRKMVRRTACPDGSARQPDQTRLFLLDTMGELRKAYALADVVLIGRSFMGLYGSDPLEPVALGKPAVIGPYHSDFADIIEALQIGGGIEVTRSPGDLAAELLINRRKAEALGHLGRKVIRARQGATDRHVDLLLSLLPGAEAMQTINQASS